MPITRRSRRFRGGDCAQHAAPVGESFTLQQGGRRRRRRSSKRRRKSTKANPKRKRRRRSRRSRN